MAEARIGLVEMPLYPFPQTNEECMVALDDGYQYIMATGKCQSCGGKLVPVEQMQNGYSMHRKGCTFILLGTHRVNLLLRRMGWK